MKMKSMLALLMFSASLFVSGCSSKPQEAGSDAKSDAKPAKAKQAEEAPESATGRAAFQKMYASARGWSADSQPLKMDSNAKKENMDGQSQLWSAVFVSANNRASRTYQWSGMAGEDAPPRGINPGSMGDYTVGNASTRPFELAFLKVDSDKAFEVAQKKGGAALLKKSPETPVKYQLHWDPNKSRLEWRVIYGISEYDAALKVWVNASSGDFIRVEK